MDWVTAYDFAEDPDQIRAMQQATLGPSDAGVSASPALVGSPEWWRAIDSGSLPLRILEGAITRVYWASMGDWPELELTSDAGEKSTWTRLGDVARYVEGLRARITYTAQAWKVSQRHLGLGDETSIALKVELEPSDRRSDPRAPGPGGVGLR